jgi:glycosyltransferase involved in cell wall biosynthesis
LSSAARVSVIIPAYNAEHFIAQTDSVLAQTYQDLEIVVVDDGSTDNTSAIVKGYGKKVRYCYEENSGVCSIPRNVGILRCSGQFLCFLDADDLMVPDRIAVQVDFMMRHPDVGLAFSNYRNFSEQGHHLESHFETCPRLCRQARGRAEFVIAHACEHLAEENFGIAGSFMVRRDMLDLVPGFEPRLKACEDFHFYYRVARHTKVGIIGRVGMFRRFHQMNVSRDRLRMLTEGIRCYSWLAASENDARAKARLDEYVGACWSDLSRYRADRGQYAQAFLSELSALSTAFSSARLSRSMKSFARTGAMALGVHRPQGI